ncbi:MAG: SH3 domain-containing protein [Pseudomonadota bacterium]
MVRRVIFTAFFMFAPTLLATGLLTAGIERAHACACCGSYQVYNVASNDVLNVRTGPSVRFPIVTGLRNGTQCIIIQARSGNWVKISYAEHTGWVNARYLQYFSGS